MQPKILGTTRSQVECELHEQHPIRLLAAEGRRIHCVSGVVWITAYDEPIDIFLRPGSTYTIPNGGLVIAEAVGTCRIRVDVPRAFDYSHYHVGIRTFLRRFLGGFRSRPKRTA